MKQVSEVTAAHTATFVFKVLKQAEYYTSHNAVVSPPNLCRIMLELSVGLHLNLRFFFHNRDSRNLTNTSLSEKIMNYYDRLSRYFQVKIPQCVECAGTTKAINSCAERKYDTLRH